MSRASAIKLFEQACDLLRQIDPGLSLYAASGTLHLLRGESYDAYGRPRQHAILATAAKLRVDGGDW